MFRIQNLIRPEASLIIHFTAIVDVETEIIIGTPGLSAIFDFAQRRVNPEAAAGEVRIEVHVDTAQRLRPLI